MKKLSVFVFCIVIILSSYFNIFAATKSGHLDEQDCYRLELVISNKRELSAHITNVERLSDNSFMVRINSITDDGSTDWSSGDYRVYHSAEAPNETPNDLSGNPSKCYYYYGLYNNGELMGYAICVREYRAQLKQGYNFKEADDYSWTETHIAAKPSFPLG